MKRTMTAALALLLITATTVVAQPHRGPRGGGMGRHGGPQAKCDGAGLDMTKKISIDGTVVSFVGGPGKGEPQLTVNTASGKKVFVPSPYRVINQAGYEFKEGAKLSIVAAPCGAEGKDEWVIVSFKDAAGKELVFRNAEGLPTGGRGPRR